jgi:acyl-CoA reductase-like NAD-dependent aldehyde dehydrogenase
MSDIDRTGIPSYCSYVGGKDIEATNWVYVLSTRALLDDAFASLSLKRKLERGDLPMSAADPAIVLARVGVADQACLADALAAAATAAPAWGARPLSERIDDFIALVHLRLRDAADALIETLVGEGHPLELARWEMSGFLDGYGPESREFYRSQMQVEYDGGEGRRLLVRRQPDGVVCVNPPSNAPMASALLASLSLAAGNALVMRAPRSNPLGVMFVMREIIAPVLQELGAPPGTLNVLCGNPASILASWIESPHVDDIMYFGSSEVGMKFEQQCVAAGKKPILELAGNDLVVVWKDADLEYAAEALCESFFGSGQLCMIPNQVLVHPEVADELIELLADRASRIRPGYPDEEGVLLTPVLRQDKFHSCLADAISKGATLVTGGGSLQLDGSADRAGMFLEPTVLRVDGLARAREIDAVRHETFFPLLPVIVPAVESDELLLDDFISFMNSNSYGLRNSVWASDPVVIDRFVSSIGNGGLLKINESHIGFVARLPTHGGTGLTSGVFGEANYPIIRTSHLQGVAISPKGRRPRDAVFGGWNRFQESLKSSV